jgi:hypothetical protein
MISLPRAMHSLQMNTSGRGARAGCFLALPRLDLPCERAGGELRWRRGLLGVRAAALERVGENAVGRLVQMGAKGGAAGDLGDTSAVLAERKPDVDRPRQTVGSSFALLIVLLDVRFVSTDDVNPVSPALQGLRDRLSRRTPLLEELREGRDESSQYGNKFRDDVEDCSHYLKESLHYLKESLHYLKESLHYLKDASHRRFRPKSERIRLLHRLQDDIAYVEGERASRLRLVAVVSRARSDVKGVLQHRSGAKSSRSKSREHRECFLQYV